MKVKELKPASGNVLIKLPDYYKTRERKMESGLHMVHMEGKYEHDATHGTVISVAENVTECQAGDEVFFAQNCVQAALQNMGMDKTRSDNMKYRSADVPAYYLIDEEAHYMMMPVERLYLIAEDLSGKHEVDIHAGIICLIREGKVHCLNGYHIMKNAYDDGELGADGIKAKKHGLIYMPVFKEESEKNKRFEIVHAPENSELKAGDIIFTAPHCDLKLEGDFNYPLLPKGCFYVQRENILGRFISAEAHESHVAETPLPVLPVS